MSEPALQFEELDLDEAIAGLLDAGIADPHTIAERLIQEHGKYWLANQMLEHAPRLLSWYTRDFIGRHRRAAARPTHTTTRLDRYSRGFLDNPVYLGAAGWKFAGEMTAEDSRACADIYRAQIEKLEGWASFWTNVADAMEEQGVQTLRDLDDWQRWLP